MENSKIKYSLVIILIVGAVSGVLAFDLVDSPAGLNSSDTNQTDVINIADKTKTGGSSTDATSVNNSKGVSDVTWFVDVADKKGLGNIRGALGDGKAFLGDILSQQEIGIYTVDFDNDNMQDLLTITNNEPTLYENRGGEFVRSDTVPNYTNVTSALFFDYDNSGYEDLYLLSDEESVFLENTGGGFTEKDVGLDEGFFSVRGATTADYTGNGCLDVFVIQANDWKRDRPKGLTLLDVPEGEDNGGQNRLFAGDCSEFEETTEEAGIRGKRWSLASSFVDLTNSGRPDIHVANDYNNDVLYINKGNGTFERRELPDFTNRNGMSSEVADVTGDGYLDIFVTNIYYSDLPDVANQVAGERTQGNNLLINQGNGKFEDKAEKYGVQKGGWGWSSLLEDFDNDGYHDIVHGTVSDQIMTRVELDQPKPLSLQFWKGTEDRFKQLNSVKSGFVETQELGIVALDYDLNGALDIATDNIDGPFRLYENQRTINNSFQVVLVPKSNTTIGSEVTINHEGGTSTRVKHANSDYRSQSTRTLHFGLGKANQVDEMRVEWPDGRADTYEDLDANQRISVSPGERPKVLSALE